ncbi:putative signal transduction histidine kinase [Crenothrix polyspora]|uniref:histidine kinase n=2 Tax=Crenothrix polyspora TaxID=360316 RepID=A0A1R4H0N7_9GAMM|nr:putative signal transduction histidine kinase [Crenothrix polyspora]
MKPEFQRFWPSIYNPDSMSLRYQINIRILLSSLCILLLGGSIAVWQARSSVNKEVESSINLAAQLISLAFFQTSHPPIDWLPQLSVLKETRHLSIQLKEPDGQIIHFSSKKPPLTTDEQPPQWFIHLVESEHPKSERTIIAANGQQLSLIILANPLDEITEAWQESLAFFNSVLLLMLFTFLTVNLVFNKALKSIATIVNALKTIETEDYQYRLPDFSIQEYDRIAKAINHLTDKLKASQQENRALTQHSLAIQEDERQKLSQELHDELSQSLTAIKVMAVTCTRPKVDVTKTTHTIIEVCDHLITIVRSMMHQLHPLILTELGLKATMEDLVYHWSLRNPQLKLMLNCADEVDELEQKMAIQLFRVVQECLTNIVRHAQATQAHITMAINPETNTLQLQITDDGQGCDTTLMNHGFGLLSMKERVKSLGGQLTYQSTPQQGMSIIASIPL